MSLVGLLSTVCVVTNKLHECFRMLNLRTSLYILKQKAAVLNICCKVRMLPVEE